MAPSKTGRQMMWADVREAREEILEEKRGERVSSWGGGRVRMGDRGLLGGGYVGVGTGDLGIWIVSLVGWEGSISI